MPAVTAVTTTTALTARAADADVESVAGVSLQWTAPAPCPGADQVRARVRELLGAEGAVARVDDALVADGTVSVVGRRYQLTFTIRRARGRVEMTRVFVSDSCESLAGAAAVTIALLSHGSRREPRSAPPSTSAPSASSGGSTAAPSSPNGAAPPRATPAGSSSLALATPPHAGSELRATEAARPASPGSREVHSSDSGAARGSARRWSLALAGPVLAIDEGMLPGTAYGVGVGAGIRAGRLETTVAGFLWMPQSGGASGPFDASYTRRSGALSGCYVWAFAGFEAGPCLALALEDITASGAGPEVVATAGHATWLTVGVAAKAAWAPAQWATFFVRPRLAFTTSRPTFAIDGVGPLYQVPLATAGFDLGCEWIL